VLRTSRHVVPFRFLVLAVLAAGGCAHRAAPAPPAEPPVATRAPESGAQATASGDVAAAPLDPSEVITAEELATIPDPVPGGTAEPPIDSAPPPREAPAAPTEGTSTGSVGDTASWIWRVQVFASPDREQAERTAHEASERLGEPYVVDRESSLYKVRLGAFTTESEAEPLKRRAVLEGYTGSFRVRTKAE
jgi:rare lipoprotein A